MAKKKKKNKLKLTAIFKPDCRYKDAPVFKYNNKSGYFEHKIKGAEPLQIKFEVVMNDKDWMVFIIKNNKSYEMDNMNRDDYYN